MFSEPAVGEKFFGRDEVLDLLNKRVSALKDGYRQNVALTGQSLSGKSSILHQFLYNAQDERLINLYVEVVKEPFRSFANKFIATLLYNTLAKLGEDVSVDMNALLDKAQKNLPKTYSYIKNINALIDKGDTDEAYLNLLNLTSVVKSEVNISCVVIFDEFDNLELIGIKNPFLNFGKVIMIQKDTMYIVSSSRNQAIRKILSEKLSLLFGNFEIVKVGGFDTKTAGEFIDVKFAGFETDEAMKKFLIAFTDGNPFYLSHITEKAREIALMRSSNYIDKTAVAKAVVGLVYNSNGVIHQYLLNYLLDLVDSRYKDAYISILVTIANGGNKQSDIARSLRIKQAETLKILSRSSELGLISKNGVFYRIDDAVLEFWLKNVYQKKKEMLIDGLLDKAGMFEEEFRRYITESIVEQSEDLLSKFTKLFNLFGNEMVSIDSRSIRLPHFTKVEICRSENSQAYILASFRGKSWLIQVYEKDVGEDEIIDYIRTSKLLGQKLANKVIIALRGMDENAKLLAKELKISIWDIETVNALLHAYGKKRVIIS